MNSFGFIAWLACVVAYFGLTETAIDAWTHPGTPIDGVITMTAIDENSKAVAATIFTATATTNAGGSGGDPPITYVLSSSTDSVGIIDIDSGVVTVATDKAFDYETAATYEFVITASDDGGSTFGTVTVSLPLNDLNDNTPAFSSNTISATVADKAASGTSVTTLTATDADVTGANNVITYSIASGNTNTDFAIGGTTGIVTVVATNGLDYATTASYALVIHATDSGSTPLTGTTTLSITVPAAAESAAAVNLASLITLAFVGLGYTLV